MTHAILLDETGKSKAFPSWHATLQRRFSSDWERTDLEHHQHLKDTLRGLFDYMSWPDLISEHVDLQISAVVQAKCPPASASIQSLTALVAMLCGANLGPNTCALATAGDLQEHDTLS